MENRLEDDLGIEDHVVYLQNLNTALARMHYSKEPGSVFGIKLSNSKEDDYSCFKKALEIMANYGFDNIGRIRDENHQEPIFVSHNLKDTKEIIYQTIDKLTDKLSELCNPKKIKVVGFIYDGKKKLDAEEAIKKVTSMLS